MSIARGGFAGLRWERLTADAMKAMQWKKLIVNAGINPIASILNAQNQVEGTRWWHTSTFCSQALTMVLYGCGVL